MTWEVLEQRIRQVASYMWNTVARSETISGVNFDCVLRDKDGHCVIIEITKENNLAKIREDIATLSSARHSLFADNVYPECFIVTESSPTLSMQETGTSNKIKVLSATDFERMYFDYSTYIFARDKRPFGSLVINDNDDDEDINYIPVVYSVENGQEDYSLNDIVKLLRRNKKVLLLGDYGTGKSCCIKQLFKLMSHARGEQGNYVFSINMREHWGAQRATEVIDRHIEDLGMDSSKLRKSFAEETNIYLLDGFDEIGTQAWVADIEKMRTLRAHSVVAIKDMLSKVKGGVLVAGREQYFNSNEEMLNAFGLDEQKAVIVRCKEEFSEEEARRYIDENNCFDMDGAEAVIPEWLPKRPLMMQLALRNTPEVFASQMNNGNECDFWYKFLELLCQREAKINMLLVPDIIKRILIYLGRLTRSKGDVGPITSSELAEAFYSVTKERPNDESMIMLQRLPGIGRADANSQDRQFIDTYILSGLRAEDIIDIVKMQDRRVLDESWIHPMNYDGCIILSQYIERKKSNKEFMSYLIQASKMRNQTFAADLTSSILLTNCDEIDFRGIVIKETYVSDLTFYRKSIKGLEFCDCIINSVDITNSNFAGNVSFRKCEIAAVVGIPAENGLPKAFALSKVYAFQEIGTVKRIKHAKLTDSQIILVTIIKKTFFQPGSGRKEEALLRGLSGKFDNKTLEKILNKLLEEKILFKHKGDEGWIYSPHRKEANRMKELMSKLTLSDDAIWMFVSSL